MPPSRTESSSRRTCESTRPIPMEFELEPSPPPTAACRDAMPGRVRCSLAIHPKHGVATVSCYHGVAFMALVCPCGIKHKAILRVQAHLLPGPPFTPPIPVIHFVVNPYPIDPAERDRDVAWFTCPPQLSHLHAQARAVAATGPAVVAVVDVETSHGRFEHRVEDLPLRGSHPELRLSLNRTPEGIGIPSSFTGGQSGSPVLNQSGEVVAVVRDSGGHCGRVVV